MDEAANAAFAPDTAPDATLDSAPGPESGAGPDIETESASGSAPIATPGQVEAQELQAFEVLMRLREGCMTKVYKDTLGKETVGIGHLVTPEDNLHLGDVISASRVDALFAGDAAEALEAARAQAREAGIDSTHFIPYLASVNFQLSTNWTKKFPNTWQMICDGQYEQAAEALNGTIWQHQTPVRVTDFQTALRNLPPKA
jgi:GH24 family phage-related lysozyme (muramidase)